MGAKSCSIFLKIQFLLFLFLTKKCQKAVTYSVILLDATCEHRDTKHSQLKQARYRADIGTSIFLPLLQKLVQLKIRENCVTDTVSCQWFNYRTFLLHAISCKKLFAIMRNLQRPTFETSPENIKRGVLSLAYWYTASPESIKRQSRLVPVLKHKLENQTSIQNMLLPAFLKKKKHQKHKTPKPLP